MIRFIDIRPNDHDQAIAYFVQCLADGTWSADKASSLIRMQDDPDSLISAMEHARSAVGKKTT